MSSIQATELIKPRVPLKKQPLKKPTFSPTANSYTESSSARGDLTLTLPVKQRSKNKVIVFNPSITPSPFLDPQAMERRVKAFKSMNHASGSAR